MNILQKNVRIRMVREDLEDVPEFGLPAGFSFRWYDSGDEKVWLKIQKSADSYNAITPEWFDWEFGLDHEPLRRRQCFLLNHTKKPVGTATAWFDEDFEGASIGRVHWVAVVPEYQRRGLGKALMTQICRCLKEKGHEKSYLMTSSGRLPAIKLYLRFGFQPLIRTADDRAAWQALDECLQLSPAAA